MQETVDRERALEFVKRYGWNATSFQCLEPGMRYWFDDDLDACVAYADTGGAWVVAGAPITAEERFAAVTGKFLDAAAREGRRVCFFATEDRFAAAVPFASLPIGEQPVWDPAEWEESARAGRSVREQLRRARAKGVTVRRVPPDELARPESTTRGAIQGLMTRWLRSRSLAPMGFLVQPHVFSFAAERRVFAAERQGRLVGFLGMVPVYAREGWLLEDLFRGPDAPNGTAELLVDAAMRSAAADGSRYATLGLAPLSGRVHRWLRMVRAFGSRFYNFDGLRAFKSKFRPSRWEPIYLSYPARQSAARSLCDGLAAFAPQGLIRFVLETLPRIPALPLRALAVLLIPWTLALALVNTARWFPSPWVQAGWVVFDIGLVFGLFSLSARWRHWLATLLATLITLDAMLTLLEVVTFNLPRVRGPLDWIVSAVGVLGPSLAALLLWKARSHQMGGRAAPSPAAGTQLPGEAAESGREPS
jgi:phosphatidylglycerol lysyltransferase